MHISEAARRSGLSAKMIRHYEAMALLPRTTRTASGYRDFSDRDVQRLQFIRKARVLGFSFAHIRTLLSLWDDTQRSAEAIKTLADSHINGLEERSRELRSIIDELQELAKACESGSRPEHPHSPKNAPASNKAGPNEDA